jgi:hypothetical protein
LHDSCSIATWRREEGSREAIRVATTKGTNFYFKKENEIIPEKPKLSPKNGAVILASLLSLSKDFIQFYFIT